LFEVVSSHGQMISGWSSTIGVLLLCVFLAQHPTNIYASAQENVLARRNFVKVSSNCGRSQDMSHNCKTRWNI